MKFLHCAPCAGRRCSSGRELHLCFAVLRFGWPRGATPREGINAEDEEQRIERIVRLILYIDSIPSSFFTPNLDAPSKVSFVEN